MPVALVDKVVEICGIPEKEVEEKWNEAKKGAEEKGFEEGSDRFFTYVTGVFKKMLSEECIKKLGWEKSKASEVLEVVEEFFPDSEITELDDKTKKKFAASAKKIVNHIEKRRKEGKYSPEKRAEIEKIFYNNMSNMMKPKK